MGVMRSPLFRSALLLALAAVALLAACPGGAGSRGGGTPDGAQVYASRNCAICHGAAREGKSSADGKPLGPPLKGLAAHWTADEMVLKYFPDPVGYQNADPRLSRMLETYSAMKMPPVAGDQAELRALAEWLLTDP
jgi:mono/diheme cytochrome c family protein